MFAHHYCSIGLYILLNSNVLCQGRRLDFGFAYPEDQEEDDSVKQNIKYKTPVYVAELCKPGEIFYPGDQFDDWICDCRPTYVYHPATDQCYPAYRRGPCEPGEYLILPKSRGAPKCKSYACNLDNYVWFRNGCHELDKNGPCMLPEISNVVGVNETTLELICTKDYKWYHFLLSARPSIDDDDDHHYHQHQLNNNHHHNGTTQWPHVDDLPTLRPTPKPSGIIDENPIVNGTKYLEKKCFIGGKRWTKNQCPEQILQTEVNESVQSIFSIPSSA